MWKEDYHWNATQSADYLNITPNKQLKISTCILNPYVMFLGNIQIMYNESECYIILPVLSAICSRV